MLNNPVLYILMRNDLDSLNPGKACAQASHATSLFEFDMKYNSSKDLKKLHEEWKNQTNLGFGTCIVLEGSAEEIDKIMSVTFRHSNREKTFMSGIVVDPTYPINDGEVTHLIRLMSCSYIFFDAEMDKSIKTITEKLELMK